MEYKLVWGNAASEIYLDFNLSINFESYEVFVSLYFWLLLESFLTINQIHLS